MEKEKFHQRLVERHVLWLAYYKISFSSVVPFLQQSEWSCDILRQIHFNSNWGTWVGSVDCDVKILVKCRCLSSKLKRHRPQFLYIFYWIIYVNLPRDVCSDSGEVSRIILLRQNIHIIAAFYSYDWRMMWAFFAHIWY